VRWRRPLLHGGLLEVCAGAGRCCALFFICSQCRRSLPRAAPPRPPSAARGVPVFCQVAFLADTFVGPDGLAPADELPFPVRSCVRACIRPAAAPRGQTDPAWRSGAQISAETRDAGRSRALARRRCGAESPAARQGMAPLLRRRGDGGGGGLGTAGRGGGCCQRRPPPRRGTGAQGPARGGRRRRRQAVCSRVAHACRAGYEPDPPGASHSLGFVRARWRASMHASYRRASAMHTRACTHARMRVRTHATQWRLSLSLSLSLSLYAVYIHVSVYMLICKCICICMYIYMYIYIQTDSARYTTTSIYLYVCVYVYTSLSLYI
jgi:hypothetical protein